MDVFIHEIDNSKDVAVSYVTVILFRGKVRYNNSGKRPWESIFVTMEVTSPHPIAPQCSIMQADKPSSRSSWTIDGLVSNEEMTELAHDVVIPSTTFPYYTTYILRAEPGPRLNIKPSFLAMGIAMLKIRRSRDRLIFNMWIPILVRRYLYIETPPALYSLSGRTFCTTRS